MLAHLLAAWTLAAPLAAAEAPFQDLTLDAAISAAKKSGKVVMIDFFTTWCAPCKKLDAVTWTDADVRKWLAATAVALKIDAAKEPALAQRFAVGSYPTIVFLKADGKETGRIEGFKKPDEFLAAAKDAVQGKDALARAKERLAGHENDPAVRHDYAKVLAQAGKPEEALAEYLWCFDHGNDDPSNGYGSVRLSFLLGDIARLGKAYAPAMRALQERRDRAESAVLSAKRGPDDARVLAALNRELEMQEKSLAVYDRLKKENRLDDEVRNALIPEIAERLVDARRYRELVDSSGNVERRVEREIEALRLRPKSSPGGDGEMLRLMVENESLYQLVAVRKLGLWYEALLGAGEPEKAAAVAEKLIGYAPSGSTYGALIERALRAEAVEAARALAERGRRLLAGSEKAELEAAAEKIPGHR
jgi:thioredoxin-related protein